MRFAESSAPKKNAVEYGMETGGGGLHFCLLSEGVAQFSAHTAGKLLFVSDRDTCSALAFAARLPRAVSVVLDGADALPLFSVPDSVGAVFAAGREQTLLSARFFAAVRGVPCAVAPSDGACFGVFCGRGRVFVDGEGTDAPLAAAEAFCDVALAKPTLGDALARLALARLARLEARALSAFGIPKTQLCEARADGGSAEAIMRANIALRKSEEAGAWRGEGAVLARRYGQPSAARAFCELSALYAAFFRRGKPRKYAVPDYAARAAHAGTDFATTCVPTPEEYARRALVLERRRADFLRETELILRDALPKSNSVSAFFTERGAEGGVSDALKYLPEHCPDGLCAVIRDFGLLERL